FPDRLQPGWVDFSGRVLFSTPRREPPPAEPSQQLSGGNGSRYAVSRADRIHRTSSLVCPALRQKGWIGSRRRRNCIYFSLVVRLEGGQVFGSWEGIVHQCTGQQLSLLVVLYSLKEGLSYPLGESTMHLSSCQQGVDDVATVINRHEALNRNLPCFRINFDDR